MLSLPLLITYLASFLLLTHLKPVSPKVLISYNIELSTVFKPSQGASDFESIESLVRFADQSHYIGRWSALTPSQENQSTMAGFTNSYGLSLVSRTQDIVLMDGEYLFNTKFVSIELDIYNGAEENLWTNKSSRVKGRVIKYKVGDNLDDLDLLITQEYTTEKLTISLMDAETCEELDSLQDEKQNIIIRVYIIGGECPFDFLAIFTPDSKIFCGYTIDLLYLAIHQYDPKEVVKDSRLTSKADLFSGKIRLISMVTLFVYTFFPARLDGTRLSAIALRTGLQWCFDIHYNPAGITLIFIAIPLLEFSYNFNTERAIKYNKFLYLGTLLPHLITMLLNLYQKGFFYLMPQPGLHLVMLLVAFFLIAFAILPFQDQIIQKIRRQVREKYSIHVANITSEDSCSICLESLIRVNTNNQGPDEAANKISLQSLIKTKCGHTYHEKCLKKWLKTKPVCCLCGAPIYNDFQYLYVLIHFSAV